MSESEYFHEIVIRNHVRRNAYDIILQQDSEQGKEFYSMFNQWIPQRHSSPDKNQSDIYRLCDLLYERLRENGEDELSVSDIVKSIWRNQPVLADVSVEISEFNRLKRDHPKSDSFHGGDAISREKDEDNIIIGEHPKWIEVIQFSQRVAQSKFSVLICGETGVGKELIATRVHNLSRRSNRQCIVINCAAFSEGLIESELFSYEANSFTGADPNGRTGWLGSADGGTLVLDEVADLSPKAHSQQLIL